MFWKNNLSLYKHWLKAHKFAKNPPKKQEHWLLVVGASKAARPTR
jgi:hypothetical protein